MKKLAYIFAIIMPVLAGAETLNIQQGSVTYMIASESAGEMLFNDGKTVTINGEVYDLTAGSRIFIDDAIVPSEIKVTYTDGGANVLMPCELAKVATVEVNGANVNVVVTQSLSVTVSGASASGQFALKTNSPVSLRLDNLTLENPSDAAVSLTGSGKVDVILTGDNSLTSGTVSEKPTLRFKTPAEISGEGSLTVKATAAAEKAIKSNDNLTISGGTITASVSGSAVYDTTEKKVKATSCIASDLDILISGGALNLTATGGGGKGISADGNLTISGGDITVKTSGGMAVYSGSSLSQNYTGNADRISSDLKASPKGMKVDGTVLISGGNIDVTTSGNGGEGIESKTTLTISGGTIAVNAYDDAINSSSHMYISGGDITVIAKNNDGLDSNGNMYISGGIVRAFGARAPECGLDANEEEGYTVIFTGGTILGVGGNNSVPSSSSASTQPYLTSNISLSAGQTLQVKNGSEILAEFIIPADYSSSGSGGGWRPAPPMHMNGGMLPPPPPPVMGPGGWGGGPGGSQGGGVLVSLPKLVKGTSYTLSNGTTTSTSTAK